MAITTDIYNLAGKVTGKAELSPLLFGVAVNPELIALAVRVFKANNRQGTSKVKSRGEVNKTGHKIWKQKGTGRARHGAKSAPIFVGGGVAHGPSGFQNYELKLPKKMRQLALKGVLSDLSKTGKVMVIEGLDKMKTSTKEFTTIITSLKLDHKKVVLLLESSLKNVVKSGKNMEKIVVSQAKRTNVVELMNADVVVIHKPALEVMNETFIQKTGTL